MGCFLQLLYPLVGTAKGCITTWRHTRKQYTHIYFTVESLFKTLIHIKSALMMLNSIYRKVHHQYKDSVHTVCNNVNV